jgi:hypothetical protein
MKINLNNQILMKFKYSRIFNKFKILSNNYIMIQLSKSLHGMIVNFKILAKFTQKVLKNHLKKIH